MKRFVCSGINLIESKLKPFYSILQEKIENKTKWNELSSKSKENYTFSILNEEDRYRYNDLKL
jgi:hypothetical protein